MLRAIGRLAVVVGACGASCASGGVVGLARSSALQTQGQVLTDDFTGTESTDQFGAFNKSIVKSGGDPLGTHGDLNVSQNTTVAQSSATLTGSGSLSAHAFGQFSNPNDVGGPLAISGSNKLEVTFGVTGAAEPFKVHGEFEQLNSIGADAHFVLSQTAPGSSTLASFQNDEFSPTIFDQILTLQAGTYKIAVDAGAGSSGSSRGDPFSSQEDTGVTFDFSVGKSATAIPLPSAVWAGLPVLVFAGALSRKRRLLFV